MVEITEEDVFRQRKILKEIETADNSKKHSRNNNVDIWIAIFAALLILGSIFFLYSALIGLCAFLVAAGVLKKRK